MLISEKIEALQLLCGDGGCGSSGGGGVVAAAVMAAGDGGERVSRTAFHVKIIYLP